VDRIEHVAERLRLYVDTRKEPVVLLELTAYATTLTMNFLTWGSFVPKSRITVRAGRRPARPRQTEETHGQTADRDRAPA
jgi:hypothetical protein